MTPSISRAALAAVLLSSPSFAAEPWEGAPFSAAPAELLAAANRQPPPPDADVDILYEETTFTLDAQSRTTARHRLLFRVVTQRGATDWSQLEAGWGPWFEERPEIRARVIRADGQVHELDPATVAEQGSEGDAQTYSDARQLRAPLPAMAVGAVVEQQVVSRGTSPMFEVGALWRASIGRQVPVRHERVVIDAPASLPLRYAVRGGLAVPGERLEGGRRIVTLDAGPLKAREDPEPFAPADPALRPSLIFTTVRSWAEVAQAYSRIVDRQIAEGDVPAVARAVLGDKPVPKDQVLPRALAWMRQNLRYTGVEFGEAAVVPRPPSEVLRRRYGDCKDLATFLVALLRSQKVEANVALLRTRWDDVDELPGGELFDHAIVRAGGRAPQWIDATSTVHAAGLLPSQDQDRLALVAAPGTSALTRTPVSSSSESTLRVTRELRLAERGDPSAREQRQGTGLVGAGLRANALGRDLDELKKLWAGYAKGFYGAEALDSFSETPVDAVDQPFVISFEAKGGGLVSTDDSGTAVTISSASLFSWLPDALTDVPDQDARDAKRKADFLLFEPYQAELVMRIVPRRRTRRARCRRPPPAPSGRSPSPPASPWTRTGPWSPPTTSTRPSAAGPPPSTRPSSTSTAAGRTAPPTGWCSSRRDRRTSPPAG